MGQKEEYSCLNSCQARKRSENDRVHQIPDNQKPPPPTFMGDRMNTVGNITTLTFWLEFIIVL
uniref:Uncharacterized protein n=1 Tax=Romanomermis culicivorax TaxID=13658 RepID=A0A915HV18_ROMCU